MTLAQNIMRFRKENGLSQQQLAEQLNLSRQSVSKWENGESLPGIDNLILLSGLLNISLDELITGEAYLSFPLHYGKPQSKKPAVLLSVSLLLMVLSPFGLGAELASVGDFLAVAGISLFLAVMLYVMLTHMLPFDFKDYYSYWTLEKTGIAYPIFQAQAMADLGPFQQAFLPLAAFLRLRQTEFISYSEIVEMEVCFVPFPKNPTKLVTINFNGYTPRMHQVLRERFYLKVTTKAGQVVELDLRAYYKVAAKERKLLGAILAFFKRKQFVFTDSRNIYPLVRKRENMIEKMYEEKAASR